MDEKQKVSLTVSHVVHGLCSTLYSYTSADNSVIVATDSIKNSIFILAKQNPVNPPELFASTVGSHFIHKYAHIHTAHVDVVLHRWARMAIDGQQHPHSFVRDSQEERVANVVVQRTGGIQVTSGIKGLTMLKSTGSQFHGFIRDEYTTLKDTWDRILSTDVDGTWTWKTFATLSEVEENEKQTAIFDATWAAARDTFLHFFAVENSPSVQNTMYKMADRILEAQPLVETVDLSLPNKHYFELDLSWHKGLENTGENAEVYVPQTNPNGLIKCTVARKPSAN